MKLKVAIGLVFISLLTGCEMEEPQMSDYKGDNMYFKIISNESSGLIIYDTRTGVEYWMSYGQSHPLTVLIDADGKPLVYNRSEEE